MIVKRTARLLLVALLVPLLVVLAPGTPAQAAVYGTAGTASIHWGNVSAFRPYSGADCNVRAYYVVDGLTQSVRYSLACAEQWNAGLLGGTVTAVFNGTIQGTAGASCSFLDTAAVGSEGNGSGTAPSISSGGMCNVSEVCLNADKAVNNNADYHYAQVCAGINMGTIPTDTAAADGPGNCDYFSVTKPKVTHPTVEQIPNYTYSAWRQHLKFSITQKKTLPVGATEVFSYMVLEKADGTATQSALASEGGNIVEGWTGTQSPRGIAGASAAFGTPGLAVGTAVAVDWPTNVSPDWQVTQQGQTYKVVGYGVALNLRPQYQSGRHMRFLNTDGYEALNDPSSCQFYWGAKFESVPSDLDIPQGDIGYTDDAPPAAAPEPVGTADPATTEQGCGAFSLTDPSTWASGGICVVASLLAQLIDLVGQLLGLILDAVNAVVGAVAALGDLLGGLLGQAVDLLGSLVDAVHGIAGAIISQLGGVLLDLFTPHPDTWGWTDLRTEFTGRAPFSLVAGAWNTVGSAVDSFRTASDCGSLIDFSDADAGSGRTSVTCQDLRDAKGMNLLYGLIQAAMIGATLWGCGSIVARSVGSKSA